MSYFLSIVRATALPLLALLLCASVPANAVELHVDFGVNDEPFEDWFPQTTNDVQAGFDDFSADQNATDDDGEIARLDLAGTSRVISGVTVGLGIVPAVFDDYLPELFLMDQRIEAGGSLGDLVEDVAAALTGDLTITLTGLPAGAYAWTSYHHLPQLDFNWFGPFDISVDTGAGLVTKASGVAPNSLGTPTQADFGFKVGSSGAALIRLHSNSPLPSVVFLNGFSLVPVPEPSAWILLASGMAALVLRQAGRRRYATAA